MEVIVVCAIVFVVMVAMSVVYGADKRRKNQGVEVTVPEGETHIVRTSDGEMLFYGVHEDKGPLYRRCDGDKVIILKGSDTNFVVSNEFFVLCCYDLTMLKIKVNIKACLEVVDFEKMFSKINRLMPYLKSCVETVVMNACHHTNLKDLLEVGISEVVAGDAMKESEDSFTNAGVRLKSFTVFDVRDAYGKTVVAEMRKHVKTKATTEKQPNYPTLEAVVDPELEKFLKDDPYPLVLNG